MTIEGPGLSRALRAYEEQAGRARRRDRGEIRAAMRSARRRASSSSSPAPTPSPPTGSTRRSPAGTATPTPEPMCSGLMPCRRSGALNAWSAECRCRCQLGIVEGRQTPHLNTRTLTEARCAGSACAASPRSTPSPAASSGGLGAPLHDDGDTTGCWIGCSTFSDSTPWSGCRHASLRRRAGPVGGSRNGESERITVSMTSCIVGDVACVMSWLSSECHAASSRTWRYTSGLRGNGLRMPVIWPSSSALLLRGRRVRRRRR